MQSTFAAVLYPTGTVSDRELSHGFAVALGGWSVPAPHLLIAELTGLAGWSVAFYRSGEKSGSHGEYEEHEHACELFEDELPPGLCVRDAVAKHSPYAKIYALTYTDESMHDDAWCFEAGGFHRSVVREGPDGIEAGTETLDEEDIGPVDIDWPEHATDQEEKDALEAAVRAQRGSAMIAEELRAEVLPALMGALYVADRRVDVRLVEATPAAITREVARLNAALGRSGGRGAFEPPSVGGVAPPPTYCAFVETYDWNDPGDPGDLFRELSIGAIEGTLHFARAADLATLEATPSWTCAAAKNHYPIGVLKPSSLGARRGDSVLALTSDGDSLRLVDAEGNAREAGPTLGELVCYLALGCSKRDEVEEDLIGALMLRARVRTE